MVRAQPQRLPVAFARRFELALRVARGAEVVPCLGKSRVQPQRAPVAGDRIGELAAILQHVAKIVVIRGRGRVELDRAAKEPLCRVELAATGLDQAQEVQRVGVIFFSDQSFGGIELPEAEVMPCKQDRFEHGAQLYRTLRRANLAARTWP